MKPAITITSLIILLFLVSGCVGGGFKKMDPGLNLDDAPINEEDSVIGDLTPIVVIGDDVSVAAYKCSTDTDCNRCKSGDVYGQECTDKTCQGPLDLVEDCKDTCSAGECIDEIVLTGEENAYAVGEDYDLTYDENAIVDNDDLLPDGTQCSPGIEKCPNYQYGIGSVYLTEFPECKCTYIYVPAGCNPTEPPCPDFSSRTNYPDCACD